VKLVAVLDKVRTSLRGIGLDVAPGGDLHPMNIDIVVQHTIAALGFEVNGRTGDLYDPSREDNQLVLPQRNVRHAGMPKRRR